MSGATHLTSSVICVNERRPRFCRATRVVSMAMLKLIASAHGQACQERPFDERKLPLRGVSQSLRWTTHPWWMVSVLASMSGLSVVELRS